MARKLFIVARGNDVIYGQLQRTVGREPGVEIIFDRRRAPVVRGRLVRAVSGVTGLLRRERSDQWRGRFGRRRRSTVGQELERRGWAVVHLDDTWDF
jgi:hypothetical protein